MGRKEPFQLTDESGRKSVPLTVNTIWLPPAFTLLGEIEAMKGGGGQTPQAEQTNATDMISRQTRDDTNRLGEFRLGADRISFSTLGRKVAAGNDTGVAGRRYMERLYSPSTGAVAVLSKDDNTHLAAVCHRDVKVYQCAKPVDQLRRTIWLGVGLS